MSTSTLGNRMRGEDAAELCGLLGTEEQHYRRLRRLAWRQSAYLKRRDSLRLERNAEEWRKFLPLADKARRRREECWTALAQRLGVGEGQLMAHTVLEKAVPADRDAIQSAVRRLATTAGELYRQNGLNALLARFCLDLVNEEAAIFRQSVLGDPAGRYTGKAQPSASSAGCVVRRQA